LADKARAAGAASFLTKDQITHLSAILSRFSDGFGNERAEPKTKKDRQT